MSRQRKNEKARMRARQITELHLRGEKGPKATTPKHGKDPANRAYTKHKRGLKDNRASKAAK